MFKGYILYFRFDDYNYNVNQKLDEYISCLMKITELGL